MEMQKRLLVVVFLSLTILSMTFVSAGFFSDLWGKITGKQVYGDDNPGYSCSDTDGGANILVKGTAVSNAPNPYASEAVDTCVDSQTCQSFFGKDYCVKEALCFDDGIIGTPLYPCPDGYSCSDGACLSSTFSSGLCTDGDSTSREITEGDTVKILGLTITLIYANEENLLLSTTFRINGELFNLTSGGESYSSEMGINNGGQFYTIELLSVSDTSATIKVTCGSSQKPTCTDSDGGRNYEVTGT